MRILCLDFGNTRLKGAMVVDDQVESYVSAQDSTPESWMPILEETRPQRIILSSVIRHDHRFEGFLKTNCALQVLSADSPLNFTIDVKQPHTIGPDRLAMVAGAVKKFPGRPVMIIGMGTCITYNVVNSSNCFTGGAISPGVDMRFAAMHHFTASLPLVSFKEDIMMPGKDTASNLQSGVLLGVIGEMEYMISSMERENQHLQVILTGGNAPYFAERLKRRIFADPDLIFLGLNALAQIHE